MLELAAIAPGIILPTAADFQEDPPGWLFCDGRAVSRTEYAALFNAIGTKFGVGDGSTTFNIPDLRGRSPIFSGQGPTAEGGGAGTTRGLGESGGAETHTLTTDQMPAHSHGGSANSAGEHSHTATLPEGSTGGGTGAQSGPNVGGTLAVSVGNAGAHTHTLTIDDTGGGNSHNNMHPFLVLNALIKT